jgi:hypothetical protein
MNSTAKLLVILGLTLVVAGVIWQFGYKWIPLGRLPGDFVFRSGATRLYFPLATCILLSVLLTAISQIIRWVRK